MRVPALLLLVALLLAVGLSPTQGDVPAPPLADAATPEDVPAPTLAVAAGPTADRAPADAEQIADPTPAAPVEPAVTHPPRPWCPAAREWYQVSEEALPSIDNGLTISGRITDEDGRPIARGVLRGRFLRCRSGFGVYGGRGQIRDGEYVFQVSGGLGGTFRGPLFEVRAPGHIPSGTDVSADHLDRLREGASLRNVDITIHRAATVVGLVTHADGTPAAGISVGPMKDRFAEYLNLRHQRRTDQDGRFVLDEFDPSTTDILVASKSAMSRAMRSEPVPLAGRLRAGEVTRIHLVLQAAQDVAVEVEIENWRDGMRVQESGSYCWDAVERVFTKTMLTGASTLTFQHNDLDAGVVLRLDIPHDAKVHRARTRVHWPR